MHQLVSLVALLFLEGASRELSLLFIGSILHTAWESKVATSKQ